jgi:hypothetical protein
MRAMAPLDKLAALSLAARHGAARPISALWTAARNLFSRRQLPDKYAQSGPKQRPGT